MKQEFKYGELVEVRHKNNEKWVQRHYVGFLNQPAPHPTLHCAMRPDQTTKTYDGIPGRFWAQIRKIQPKTNDQTTPKPGTIEYLQGQIQGLSRRIYNLESELNLLK